MPGFNIGPNSNGLTNQVEMLFNHRWLITMCGSMSRDSTIVAKECSLPSLKIEQQDILAGSTTYKFAKSAKWDDVEIIFYDNGSIIKDLTLWSEMVYSNADGIGKHSKNGGYKKKCEIGLLDGQGGILNKHILHNAWPKSINHGKLTYTSSDIKLITLVLAFDYAESLGHKEESKLE